MMLVFIGVLISCCILLSVIVCICFYFRFKIEDLERERNFIAVCSNETERKYSRLLEKYEDLDGKYSLLKHNERVLYGRKR